MLPDIYQTIKRDRGWAIRVVLEVSILVLFGVASYYLGRASMILPTGTSPAIVVLNPIDGGYENIYKKYKATTLVEKTSNKTGKSMGAFGASVNGTKYYPAGCGGLSRIKTENLIWFSSEQEAIDAGLSRATNC